MRVLVAVLLSLSLSLPLLPAAAAAGGGGGMLLLLMACHASVSLLPGNVRAHLANVGVRVSH
jgi:hypothetical protein